MSNESKSRTDFIAVAHVEILHRLRDPIFVFDAQGRILFKNLAACLLLENAKASRGNKHCGLERSRDSEGLEQRLREAVGAASIGAPYRVFRFSNEKSTTSWLMVVKRLSGTGSLVVQLIQLKLTGRFPKGILMQLFSITPKEMDVVEGLMRRHSLRVIATELNISHDTVRARLKQIFLKCEVSSQLKLLTMVQRIAHLHP